MVATEIFLTVAFAVGLQLGAKSSYLRMGAGSRIYTCVSREVIADSTHMLNVEIKISRTKTLCNLQERR